MIDHISFEVEDIARSQQFYVAVLAPLGIELMANEGDWVGFGLVGSVKADLWMGPVENSAGIGPMHFAITAQSREQVDSFYAVALASGAKDNGAPGIRPHYHENYYAAFVIDPDGHNLEAVCHSGV